MVDRCDAMSGDGRSNDCSPGSTISGDWSYGGSTMRKTIWGFYIWPAQSFSSGIYETASNQVDTRFMDTERWKANKSQNWTRTKQAIVIVGTSGLLLGVASWTLFGTNLLGLPICAIFAVAIAFVFTR